MIQYPNQPMLKLIIAGGRDFKNYPLLQREVDNFIQYLMTNGEIEPSPEIEIVSGKQVTKPSYTDRKTWHGADYLGELYAESYNIPVKPFPADWNGKYGRGAGMIRNEQMAQYADACICFWDGISRGTKNMIDNANKYNLVLRIINY